jgi:4-amino-4-deoxy-L-arabinose transferase-like glycosyltransferase
MQLPMIKRSSNNIKYSPWLPIIFCLGLNIYVCVSIWILQPAYLQDYMRNHEPDARNYVLLGRNLLLEGQYSRCPQPPFYPDILRTPIYPLFAGALDIVGGPILLYLVQAILQACSCWLLYHLVRPHFGRTAAFWASMLIALDFMLVISNFEALSEVLFLFLALAAACSIMPVIVSSPNRPPEKWRLPVGGLLLAAAILTRPAGLYLPFVYALLLVGFGLARRRLAVSIGHALLFLAVSLAPVVSWIVRNHYVFSINRLTTVDSIDLVYFAGAGAFKVERRISLNEARNQISAEFHLPPLVAAINYWITNESVASIDARFRAAAFPVLSRYPLALAKACLIGVVKSSISHNASVLSGITGISWINPNAEQILRGDFAALRRFASNEIMMVFNFIWQIAHNLLTILLAGLGLILALRRAEHRPLGLALLAVLLYFLLTVCLIGPDAYFRNRAPHMPYLFALSGLALAKVLGRRRSDFLSSAGDDAACVLPEACDRRPPLPSVLDDPEDRNIPDHPAR